MLAIVVVLVIIIIMLVMSCGSYFGLQTKWWKSNSETVLRSSAATFESNQQLAASPASPASPASSASPFVSSNYNYGNEDLARIDVESQGYNKM